MIILKCAYLFNCEVSTIEEAIALGIKMDEWAKKHGGQKLESRDENQPFNWTEAIGEDDEDSWQDQ
jgi:hypothetical protein